MNGVMLSPLISLMLFVTASVNLLLMFMIVAAYRPRAVHAWFGLLTGAAAVWAIAINGFLTTSEPALATLWARIYYVAGALIAYALLEFSLHYPRVIPVKRWTQVLIALLFAGLITTLLMKGGLIHEVVVSPGVANNVNLNIPLYYLYTAYYVVAVSSASWLFVAGIIDARRRRGRRMSRLLTVFGLCIAISIIGGMWFNLILPLLGSYSYIWAGPPCAIVFALAALVAITQRGILDLKQTFVRTVVYAAVVVALIAVYSVVVFGVLQLFLPSNSSRGVQVVVQTTIAVLLALMVQPLREFFDRVVGRVFYRNTYSIEDAFDQLRDITSNEVKTAALATKTLDALQELLHAERLGLYVFGDQRKRIYTTAGKLTDHQRYLWDELATLVLPTMPRVIDRQTVEQLTQPRLEHVFNGAHLQVVVRLSVRHQPVGLLIIGAKRSGKHYGPKDIRLLTTVADELAIAVQNSLRFEEIQVLNATLQERISEATKELRTSNRQLQKLDEAKDEFVSMASHQLRTPLTSVKGYIDMVLQGDAGKITPMQHQLLSEAFTSSERMVHLINDFLNVSRLQTGKFMLDRRAIDLAKVVGQEVDALRTTAGSRELTLQYHPPSRLPILYLDEGKLRQVVMNFIDNAIYYSREHSTIKIRLAVEAGDVVFEVHDKGIGVPKAEQAHLFTKFFRAANARKQRPDGTGVGIYLAKRVISDHGGSMIFSSSEGEGSVFGFRLPVKRLSTAPADDADQLNS